MSGFSPVTDHYICLWGGHSELWVKDGDNHDTFAVVDIMTEYNVWHILKAITYYHLLRATIRICTTNQVNTVCKYLQYEYVCVV